MTLVTCRGKWHKNIESRFNEVEELVKVKYPPPLKIKRWWVIYRASPYAKFFMFFCGNTATQYLTISIF